MASFQFLVSLCAVAAILVARVESTCDSTGLAKCVDTLTTSITGVSPTSSRDQYCKVYKTYFDCADKADIAACAGNSALVKSAYDNNKSAYSQICGAAQFLMSWPMYITVLALSFKRLYDSAL